MDDKARDGDTRLAAVLIACPGAGPGGGSDIGVVEDDERIAAAEFEDGLFEFLASGRGDGTTRPVASLSAGIRRRRRGFK